MAFAVISDTSSYFTKHASLFIFDTSSTQFFNRKTSLYNLLTYVFYCCNSILLQLLGTVYITANVFINITLVGALFYAKRLIIISLIYKESKALF